LKTPKADEKIGVFPISRWLLQIASPRAQLFCKLEVSPLDFDYNLNDAEAAVTGHVLKEINTPPKYWSLHKF